MEIDSKMLVASLRNYAEAKHMQLQDVGKQLGFSKDRTKSIFTGRSKLTGDDVLRILMNVDIPLPELKRYRQLWRLRREVLNFERPDDFEQFVDGLNVSATLFPRKVQGSLARSDNERVSTELARDMMARENWYVLRNGWVCALKVEGKWVTFTPFAPDFMTAARAMIGLKWIHRKTETSIPFIDWGAVRGGCPSSEETSRFVGRELLKYIQSKPGRFPLDDEFRGMVAGKAMGEFQQNRILELEKSLNKVKEIAESSLKYSLSTEKDEYGISPAEIYSSVFDYLESNVTNLYGIRHLLLEDGITIPPQLEEECERVLGLNERHYKYSLYIEPILAVNDLPDRLASPTKAERVQYEKLRADSEEKSKKSKSGR